MSRLTWVRDTLIAAKHSEADADRVVAEVRAEVRAEQAAEIERLRNELAALADRARRVAVSHELFIQDHSDPGTEALAAQYMLISWLAGSAHHEELPLHPVETALRVVLAELDQWDGDVTPAEIRAAIAQVLPRKDMSDRRRRIHIDGKGDAWIDSSQDVETGEWDVSGITAPWRVESASDLRAKTGSLREIGRCW